MGETQAGLVGGAPQITGIQQVAGRPPYPEVMLESLVHDAGELGADYLLAAGDISAEAVPADLSKALQLLKRFGRYRRDYFVARGNHDRAHDGDAYAACSVGEWQGNDCFHDQFFPGGEPTYFPRELRGLRVVGIDTYDKPGTGKRRRCTLDRPARVVPGRARQGPGPADARVRPPSARGRELAVPRHAEQHARRRAGSDHPGRLLPRSRTVPAPRRAHPPQQAHHQPGRARRHAPGDRRRQGVSRRLLTPPAVHRGLRARTSTRAAATSPANGANEAGSRSRGLWPQFALGSSVQDRNTVVEHDLSNLRPVRRG